MSLRIALLIVLATTGRLHAQTLGGYWDTAEEEAKYYKIVEVPISEGMALEAGSFEVLPDNRLAIGTRRGDIYLVSGAFDENPRARPRCSLPCPASIRRQTRGNSEVPKHHSASRTGRRGRRGWSR